jgi:hypothetical protein
MWEKIGKIYLVMQVLLFAGELNFIASVDKTEVGINEPVILRVTVEGENIGKVPSPQLPDLPDFDIGTRSSSQSTNIQLIDGKMTQQQTISFIYTLYPKKIGAYEIGACILEFKGETYKTQPIDVTVVKGTAKTPSQPQPNMPVPQEPGVAIEENLKLVATASRKNVYVGEQIITEYSLYNRLNINNVNFSEMPSFSGFWVEPIFDAQRLDFQQRSVKGKLYHVAVLKKSALFPMTSGKLRVNPMALSVSVVQAPRDFFDFYGTTKSVQIESEPIYINVEPLPMNGKPEEFTGGVGNFTIKASLDRTKSEGAEPINLIVKISGTGNVKLIEKPNIPSIAGVKILDPEIKDNITFTDDVVKGYKEFRYPLIPQIDGEYMIPPIKVAYFNPRDKKYHIIETGKLVFNATQTATAKEMVEAAGIEVLGSDILHIKPDATALESDNLTANWWIVFFYIGSLVIIGWAILYHSHQVRLLSDRGYARKLRASRLVKKRLMAAENHLRKKESEKFFAMLSKVVLGYIGDRFNLDVGALTNEQLIEELRKRNTEQGLIVKITELLNQCDIVRFSRDMEYGAPQEFLRTAKEILSKL